MPQILSAGGNAATLSGVDDVYVLIQPPSSAALPGAQTNIVGLVGSAPWGPLNTPVTIGSGADLASNFGSPTTAAYDMPTDVFLSLQSGANNIRAVRVSDGTDTAATLKLFDNTGFATGTLTVGGTFSAGVTLTVTIGGVVTTYTTQTTDVNVAGVATSLAAAINASAAVSGGSPVIQAVTVVGAVITAKALVQGTAGNAITTTATGSGVTCTWGSGTLTTGAAPGLGATLTARYTGSFPSNPPGGVSPAAALFSQGSAFATTSPTYKLTITFPGATPEIYDNIVAYAMVGGGFSGSTFWANVVAAVNASPQLNALRPASAFFSAAVGSSTIAPVLNVSLAITTAGTDGSTFAGGQSQATTAALGNATATPPTGMYALSGQVNGGQFTLCGSTDIANAGPAMSAFALSANAHAVISHPTGTSTTAAIAAKQLAGLSSYAITVLKDFIEFTDSVNNITSRRWPGSAIALSLMATTPPQTSPANQRANLVTGTERTGAAVNNPYSPAELAQLEAAGINLFANPCPGGAYFGLRHNKNSLGPSDPRGNIAYSMMTKYLAQSYASTLIGQFIGLAQSRQSNDPLRSKVRASYNDFNARLQAAGVIDSFYTQCDLRNNPVAQISTGLLRVDNTVAYLSIVDRIVVSLTGGQTVKVNVLPATTTAQS